MFSSLPILLKVVKMVTKTVDTGHQSENAKRTQNICLRLAARVAKVGICNLNVKLVIQTLIYVFDYHMNFTETQQTCTWFENTEHWKTKRGTQSSLKFER